MRDQITSLSKKKPNKPVIKQRVDALVDTNDVTPPPPSPGIRPAALPG